MEQRRPIVDSDDVKNVHYVDSLTTTWGVTNYLFRGGLPLKNDGSFNYPGLTSAINAAAKGHVSLPSDYRIHDINLLQWENPDEVFRIETEYNFFLDNPLLGSFMFWETKGTGICPLQPPLSDNAVQDYLARNLDEWLSDTLVQRVSDLRNCLETFDTPTVIYVHCEGGDDRTGELIGSYYMAYMGMSWSQVNELNHQIAGRPFGCNNFRATLWYAIHLYLTTGRPDDTLKPFECDDNGDYRFACGGPET